ncbi:MAG TPA: nuclear transport factor 2 family protein [Ramlibacter sp.]|uniref:nuclear transport factor 2 family protein n=1 Tax=Ramlibacter sp. TaxID=1917967 RepID=UPI002D7E5D34|nr:nuclear transport factor 2 family protein [Ramlibacter sp.]HET8748825.1 nuclear transport factor 2 family protein [Ramlibacter sp.]
MSQADSVPATSPNRSAAEVFESHLAFRKQHDLEQDIATNYSEDVVLLTLTGIFRGLPGLRACAAELQEYFPDGHYDYRVRLVEGEIAFLAWSGRSATGKVHDGADTFHIRDGKIVVQTIHYTVDRD